MVFQEEGFEDACKDMLPFISAHHTEISKYTDLELAPDMEKYKTIAEHGLYSVFTVRSDEGELLGYAGFFMSPMLHFKNSHQAVCDLIYVRPEYRRSGIGNDFVSFIDDMLREKGISAVFYNVPAKMDWSELLVKKGYELHDRMYSRRI